MNILFATSSQYLEGTRDDQLVSNSLKRQGHRVEYRDWRRCETTEGFDGVLIRSTWDYQKHLDEFLRWCMRTENDSKLINSANIIKWNCDKNYLKEFKSIVPSLFTSKADLISNGKIALEQYQEIIIKPTISGSAQGLMRIKEKESLETISADDLYSEYLIQPYLQSIETSGEVSLIFFKSKGETVFSHGTVKRPANGEYRVQEEYGGSTTYLEMDKGLIDFSLSELETIKYPFSFVRVDVVNWENDPMISEIELIEPDLYMRCAPDSADLFAEAIINTLVGN